MKGKRIHPKKDDNNENSDGGKRPRRRSPGSTAAKHDKMETGNDSDTDGGGSPLPPAPDSVIVANGRSSNAPDGAAFVHGDGPAVVPEEGDSPAAVPGEGDGPAAVPGENESPAAVPGENESPAAVPGENDSPAVIPGEGDSAAAIPGEGDSAAAIPGEGDGPALIPGEGYFSCGAVSDDVRIIVLLPSNAPRWYCDYANVTLAGVSSPVCECRRVPNGFNSSRTPPPWAGPDSPQAHDSDGALYMGPGHAEPCSIVELVDEDSTDLSGNSFTDGSIEFPASSDEEDDGLDWRQSPVPELNADLNRLLNISIDDPFDGPDAAIPGYDGVGVGGVDGLLSIIENRRESLFNRRDESALGIRRQAFSLDHDEADDDWRSPSDLDAPMAICGNLDSNTSSSEGYSSFSVERPSRDAETNSESCGNSLRVERDGAANHHDNNNGGSDGNDEEHDERGRSQSPVAEPNAAMIPAAAIPGDVVNGADVEEQNGFRSDFENYDESIFERFWATRSQSAAPEREGDHDSTSSEEYINYMFRRPPSAGEVNAGNYGSSYYEELSDAATDPDDNNEESDSSYDDVVANEDRINWVVDWQLDRGRRNGYGGRRNGYRGLSNGYGGSSDSGGSSGNFRNYCLVHGRNCVATRHIRLYPEENNYVLLVNNGSFEGVYGGGASDSYTDESEDDGGGTYNGNNNDDGNINDDGNSDDGNSDDGNNDDGNSDGGGSFCQDHGASRDNANGGVGDQAEDSDSIQPWSKERYEAGVANMLTVMVKASTAEAAAVFANSDQDKDDDVPMDKDDDIPMDKDDDAPMDKDDDAPMDKDDDVPMDYGNPSNVEDPQQCMPSTSRGPFF